MAAGAATIGVGMPLLNAAPAFASNIFAVPDDVTPVATIFKIAENAEQLAITLYKNIVKHARDGSLKPKLWKSELEALAAAGIEEQIHHQLFASVTGLKTFGPTVFSFPDGPETFTDLRKFVTAQQTLEGVFDSAFLAAVRELSVHGEHRLAQIAAQIAVIESEHRALGRQILANHGISTIPNTNVKFTDDGFGSIPLGPNPLPTSPADNWAFAPVFVESVPDAVDLAKAAGYLSPKGENSFSYGDGIDINGEFFDSITDRIQFKSPFINTEEQVAGGPDND
jgi:hypothetical protein